MHRILLNAFRSSRRRLWHRERPTDAVPEPAVADRLDDVDRVDAVVRSLRSLSDDHRVAVVLRYYGNLTEEQMAAVLGVARGTVKSRLSRALEALSRDPGLVDLLGGHR